MVATEAQNVVKNNLFDFTSKNIVATITGTIEWYIQTVHGINGMDLSKVVKKSYWWLTICWIEK
tara:strand:+ start:296 stop:487 length:192 start_codon:yes stop_codon:yes gene_type:complete